MPSPGGPYSVMLVTGDGGTAAPDAKLALIDRLVAAPSLSGVKASSTISESPAHAIPASPAHTHTSRAPISTGRAARRERVSSMRLCYPSSHLVKRSVRRDSTGG